MTELDYWLWLSLKKGIGACAITRLLEMFETPEQIYRMSKKELTQTKALKREEVRLLSDKSLKPVEKVKEKCKRLGIRILTYSSVYYPEKLKQLPDPPYVLYVLSKERINLNDKLCISVVGNRIMTDYGRCVTTELVEGLTTAGVVVVSGMARGIDTTAHIASLRAGGITVAVLGCGLDIAYPPENDELMNAISENGMVISEYPPGTPPMPKNFPTRNRIISGLSDGVVVTEAPDKSGALITAEYALEQNRDLFAVPGDITRGHSKGTHGLIRQGATLVSSANDILREYKLLYMNTLKQYTEPTEEKKQVIKENTAVLQDERYDGLSETAKKVVSNLSITPIQFDKLLHITQLSAEELSAELMMLEISGFVKTLPGKNFVLNV